MPFRSVLSRHADIDPAYRRFVRNAYGRLEVALKNTPPLRFNLSSARSLVACIITRSCGAGVDVEELIAVATWLRSQAFFAPAEVTALHAAPEA